MIDAYTKSIIHTYSGNSDRLDTHTVKMVSSPRKSAPNNMK